IRAVFILNTHIIIMETLESSGIKALKMVIEESPMPIALYLGPEIRIKIANKAMLQAWGKGSEVLGKTLEEAVPELSDQPFPDLLRKVYRTGVIHEAREDRAL